MTHAKLRGWMPWAHLPFMPGTAAFLPSLSPGDDLGSLRRCPHIMHPDHAGTLHHRPHGGGHGALEAVIHRSDLGGGGTVRGREEPAEEPLAGGADDDGKT